MTRKKEDEKRAWKETKDNDLLESPHDELPLDEIKKEKEEEQDKKATKDQSSTMDKHKP
ncbi:hypothetical protein JCM19045_1212 [Bacillus sp. JCM 19045]|nr:hypothetical protein JCM19045_1212 [Bacillus sp. JCM 19045]